MISFKFTPYVTIPQSFVEKFKSDNELESENNPKLRLISYWPLAVTISREIYVFREFIAQIVRNWYVDNYTLVGPNTFSLFER